ncbi:MAG TPA: efflux RND transporter periplasmic adaptor subunit [Candidatus Binatus sp.]|nr:efflux RND transporter periplasmic adaptor subunit [Candidatus Binatus sp.]
MRARKKMLPVTIHSNGMLKPANETQIFSRLAGRITELRFKVGDTVAAGAVVATIYSSAIARRQNELEANVAAAQKELKQQEIELAKADAIAAQRRDLFKQDLISRRELEQAETTAQTTRAQAELARAQSSQQESMLAQTRKVGRLGQITAPVGGLVSRRLVEVGAAVDESTPIIAILIDHSVKFSGTVSSSLVSGIRRGLKAMISSPSAKGKSFDGTVSSFTPGLENRDAAIDVEIHIEKPAPELAAGMTAQALIYLDRSEPLLLLQRAAVVESAGKSYVFKITAGRAVKQEVRQGAMADNEIVIEGGISENDLVIVDQLSSIQTGSRVRPLHETTGVTR